MKGAEQLARSCRRLGREGVGARRAGTRARTRAARTPRRTPRGSAPLPGPAAAALAPRGAERRAPAAGEDRSRLSRLSLSWAFLFLVFFFWRRLDSPFLGQAACGRPLSRVSSRPLFGYVPGDCCCLCY